MTISSSFAPTGLSGATQSDQLNSVPARLSNGSEVKASTTSDSLAQSLEELSQALASLKKRDAKSRKIANSSERDIMSEEDYSSLLNEDNQHKPQLNEILDQLTHLQPKAGQSLDEAIQEAIKEASRELQQQGFDPYEEFAGFTLMLNKIKSAKTPSTEITEGIEQHLSHLWDQHESAIQAGLNIQDATSQYGHYRGRTGLDSARELRRAYKSAVQDFQGLYDSYQTIVERFGSNPKRFKAGLDFLVKAAGADIYSEKESIPTEKLQVLLNDLFYLKSLNGVHTKCVLHANRLVLRGYTPFDAQDVLMLKQVLGIRQQDWQASTPLEELPVEYAVRSIPGLIYFFQGIYQIINEFPFRDPCDDNRLEIKTRIQDLLDSLIAEEEIAISPEPPNEAAEMQWHHSQAAPYSMEHEPINPITAPIPMDTENN